MIPDAFYVFAFKPFILGIRFSAHFFVLRIQDKSYAQLQRVDVEESKDQRAKKM